MAKTVFVSRCGDEQFRGKPEQLVGIYEAKGYEARRAGDSEKANIYFQHAEHWKKMVENES